MYSRNRLAIILGGGTAGSVIDDKGYISIDSNTEKVYREILTPLGARGVKFEYIVPEIDGRDARCDSSDATWEDRIAVLRAIEMAMIDPSVNGIVVTYGTDTEELMGNTIHLGGNSAIYKPIVVCGSLYPIGSEKYDFPINLLTAAIFAYYSNVSGVFHVRTGHSRQKIEEYGVIIFHDFGKHRAEWHDRTWEAGELRDILAKVYYGRIRDGSSLSNLEQRQTLIEFQKPEKNPFVDYADNWPTPPWGQGKSARVLGLRRSSDLLKRRRELGLEGFTNPFLVDYVTWRNLRTGNTKQRNRAENVDWKEITADYEIPETAINLLKRIWAEWGLEVDPKNKRFSRFDTRFSSEGIWIIDSLMDPSQIQQLVVDYLVKMNMLIIIGTGAGHVRTSYPESFWPTMNILNRRGIPKTILAGTPGEIAGFKYEIARRLMQKGIWASGARSRFSAVAIAAYLNHPDHRKWMETLASQFSIKSEDLLHQLWCSDMIFETSRDRDIYREHYPHIETRVQLAGGMPFVESALIAAMGLSRIQKGNIPNINEGIESPLPEPI